MGQHRSKQLANGGVSPAQPPFRAWKQLAFGSRPLIEAPIIAVDVKGLRSDDVVIGVTVGLRLQQMQVIRTPQDLVNYVLGGVNEALKQLQTFKDCKCELNKACEEHRQ